MQHKVIVLTLCFKTEINSVQRKLQPLNCLTRIGTEGVDPTAQPLLERIECHLQIDHDHVARVTLRSTRRGDSTVEEFHELEFGLSLGVNGRPGSGEKTNSASTKAGPAGDAIALAGSNLVQRTNVAHLNEKLDAHDSLWKFVPGDLLANWRSSHFDTQGDAATARQHGERLESGTSMCLVRVANG